MRTKLNVELIKTVACISGLQLEVESYDKQAVSMAVILSYTRKIQDWSKKEDQSFVCQCVPVHLIADQEKTAWFSSGCPLWFPACAKKRMASDLPFSPAKLSITGLVCFVSSEQRTQDVYIYDCSTVPFSLRPERKLYFIIFYCVEPKTSLVFFLK